MQCWNSETKFTKCDRDVTRRKWKTVEFVDGLFGEEDTVNMWVFSDFIIYVDHETWSYGNQKKNKYRSWDMKSHDGLQNIIPCLIGKSHIPTRGINFYNLS